MKTICSPKTPQKQFNIDKRSLMQLSRERWTTLCRLFCLELGLSSRNIPFRNNFLVDFALHLPDSPATVAYVLCLMNREKPVPPELIRNFHELLKHDNVANGIIFTVGTFFKSSRTDWDGARMDLIDGEDFVRHLNNMPPPVMERMESEAFATKFLAPICLHCGIPMMKSSNKLGTIWICANAPQCHCTYMY